MKKIILAGLMLASFGVQAMDEEQKQGDGQARSVIQEDLHRRTSTFQRRATAFETSQENLRSNDDDQENDVISTLARVCGLPKKIVENTYITQQLPLKHSTLNNENKALFCFNSSLDISKRAVNFFLQKPKLTKNELEIKMFLTCSMRNCKHSSEMARKKHGYNTFKAFLGTCISGFSTIWGIRSLCNKENSPTLSYSSIAGGSVGLFYAVPSLIKNFSSWRVTRVKEQQYSDWLTKLESTKEQ